MEQITNKKKTTDKVEDVAATIRTAYMSQMLDTGKAPASVHAFAKSIKITESEFYQHYNSFPGVEKDIWHHMFLHTKLAIESEEVYADYSVREKLLAFYFTFFEHLLKSRSYVLLVFGKMNKLEAEPPFLAVFHNDFKHYIKELVMEGIETDEIVGRPYISDNYHRAFWVQLMFLMRFWINDDSKGFEKTDAAIEKSVNLAMDLVAKGPLDSMIDFAKFLLQNRK